MYIFVGKLIQSLNTYSAIDNTVQVFNRVFKNELEEDFRFIHEGKEHSCYI